jgi:hypothetical protein
MHRESTPDRCAVAVESIACVAAAISVIAYLLVAFQRIAYPFDLEWMEGSMVHHVSRVLDGKPLYASPTLDFTPFLYPPLYYYVSAAPARVIGLGFLPLRLVSFGSSALIFWFIYRLAQRDTGSRYAGVVAAGLFAATYRIGGAWFDLARNDSLFLALMLAAIYLIRFRESWTGWAWAGLLLALSALTKQTALLMAPPLLLCAALVDWRKAAVLTLTFGAVLGGATWALNIRTHGWYVYYVFRLPRQIQDAASDRFPFWTHDILTAIPMASALALATLIAGLQWRDRRSAFWPMVACGGIGAAWLSRLHVGAYDNVLIPAYVCLCLLAGIAGRHVPDRLPARQRPFVRLAVAALLVIQMASLRYSIKEQTPSAHDTELALQLGRRLAESNGQVFVPFHSFVPTPAGPVMHAHSWAVFDVLRAGDAAAAARLTGEIKYAFDQGEYRMVVIDKIEPWMEPDLDRWYRPSESVFDSNSLWTRTGYPTHPRWIYVPKIPTDSAPQGAGKRR